MPASGEKFAQLLTEALYQIRLRESKPLQVIQDELGYAMGRNGGSVIDYWRRGNLPTKLADLEQLTRTLQQRGLHDQRWIETFLTAGGYPPTQTLTQPVAASKALDPNLPKRYRQLVGRDSLVRQVLQHLSDREGYWVIAIDGMGGIGKTALAMDLMQRFVAQQPEYRPIWISAEPQQGGGILPNQPLTFDSLITNLVRQLALADVAQLSVEEKFQRLQQVLKHQPILLVLDNLETSGEPQQVLLEKLRPLLQPSKVILTSRQRFKGEVFSVHLIGLEAEQAALFIRQDASEKGVQWLQQASLDDLQPIIKATGGSPLAMKLVVSQLASLPLDLVLQHVQSVTQLNPGDEDAYVRFYMFLFQRSWTLLELSAKQLLVSLARFVPSNGCDWRAMQQISALPAAELAHSIDMLWKLSLLELNEGERFGQLRYYLHPLTQHFVLSEIAQVL